MCFSIGRIIIIIIIECSSAQIWYLWFDLHSLAKCPNFWYFSALIDVLSRKSLNLMAFSAISWSFSWTVIDLYNLFTRFSFDESYWGVFISFISGLKVLIFCFRRYRPSSELNGLIGTVWITIFVHFLLVYFFGVEWCFSRSPSFLLGILLRSLA